MKSTRITSHRFGILLGVTAVTAGLQAQASDLFGIEFAGPTDLFRIDQTTGLVASIGASGHDNLGDLTSDTRPGSPTIWGVRIASNELFAFNPATGAATSVATLNSVDNMTSLAFDPVGAKLYGNTSKGFGAPADALYQIDPVSGNTTLVGPIGFDNVYALGFDQSGRLFGVADATDELIAIDTTTGAGSLIAHLPLGLSFDIASRPEDNVMFLADSGTYTLYTVNTGTGAVSPVGSYGSTPNVVGLAFLPVVPEASTYLAAGSLGGLGLLAELRRRRRALQG